MNIYLLQKDQLPFLIHSQRIKQCIPSVLTLFATGKNLIWR